MKTDPIYASIIIAYNLNKKTVEYYIVTPTTKW